VGVALFELPLEHIVQNLSFIIGTPSTGGKCGVGLYTGAGNLILSAGGLSTTSSGQVNFAFTSGYYPVLPAGPYYLAWTADNTTVTFTAFATNQTYQALSLAGRTGTAANSSTNGVLPATMGAITGAQLDIPCVFFLA
jgi:hypothetical protein